MTLGKNCFENIVGKWVNIGNKIFCFPMIVLALLNTNNCSHKMNYFLIGQIGSRDEKRSVPFSDERKRSIFIFSKSFARKVRGNRIHLNRNAFYLYFHSKCIKCTVENE